MFPDEGDDMSSNAAIDRRARATRDSIGRAFLKLGGIGGIEALSVGVLAREAGIARSTFYAHYRGIDDYLARGFAGMLQGLARAELGNAILPVRAILDHVVAAGEGASSLLADRRFPLMMVEGGLALKRVAIERLAERSPNLSEVERRSLATILSAGFLALMREWIEQGRKIPAGELAGRFETIERRLTAP